MKKYLGIIKLVTETAIGVNIRVLTKFSSSKSYIAKWMDMYPNAHKILLDNNESLEQFFKDFEDYTAVTKTEKVRAEKLYQRFMNEE